MSDEEAQRAAVIALLEERSAANTASPEQARRALIKQKILNRKGELSARYGGRGAKKAPAPAD